MRADSVEGRFHVHPHKQKYLIYAEQCAETHILPLIKTLLEQKLSFAFHFLTDRDEGSDEKLSLDLSRQKMGTHLCLAGRYETIARVKKLALDAGFSEEEIQIMVIGAREINLFCAACQQILKVTQSEQVSCSSCGRLLTVTPHYSRRLQAYLGYIEIT